MQHCFLQQALQVAGLAIKDFWGVDGDTVVFVADPSLGNILNFNVGENVDLKVPKVGYKDLKNVGIAVQTLCFKVTPVQNKP